VTDPNDRHQKGTHVITGTPPDPDIFQTEEPTVNHISRDQPPTRRRDHPRFGRQLAGL